MLGNFFRIPFVWSGVKATRRSGGDLVSLRIPIFNFFWSISLRFVLKIQKKLQVTSCGLRNVWCFGFNVLIAYDFQIVILILYLCIPEKMGLTWIWQQDELICKHAGLCNLPRKTELQTINWRKQLRARCLICQTDPGIIPAPGVGTSCFSEALPDGVWSRDTRKVGIVR